MNLAYLLEVIRPFDLNFLQTNKNRGISRKRKNRISNKVKAKIQYIKYYLLTYILIFIIFWSYLNTMSLPNKPHDHLFKSTFADPRIASDYIRNFLPKGLTSKLDLTSLELAPTTYITPELEEFLSDVVYTCNYGEESLTLSLLFEHKSSPDGIIYLQLLRYLLEAWDKQSDKTEGLKIIVPIVVYHGKRKWKKKSFLNHFPGIDDILSPFIPSFQYLLTDLSRWSDEALMTLKVGLVKNVLLILKHYQEEGYIQHSMHRLFWDTESYLEDPSQKQHFDVFWRYLYYTSKLEDTDFRKLIDNLSNTLKDEAMTTYEHIIRKGKIEGEKEKENFFITNAFKQGLEVSLISQLTGLTEQEVKERINMLGLEK